jgi:predicted metal-dependent hydrolase
MIVSKKVSNNQQQNRNPIKMKSFLIDILYNNTAIDVGKIVGVQVNVVRAVQSKSISVRIDFAKNSITLTHPFFVSERVAIDFLQSKYDWIYMNFAKKKIKEQSAKSDFNLQIVDGEKISICGRIYNLKNDTNAVGVFTSDNNLIVSGNSEFISRRVKDFAKKEFVKYIRDYIRNQLPEFQSRIKNISMKDTTSRWGSCSSVGNLSFSYRVAFAPKFVIDYLIVHELCHLQEMNHSKNFWKLVDKYLPAGDAKLARNWLTKNGFLLHSL